MVAAAAAIIGGRDFGKQSEWRREEGEWGGFIG